MRPVWSTRLSSNDHRYPPSRTLRDRCLAPRPACTPARPCAVDRTERDAVRSRSWWLSGLLLVSSEVDMKRIDHYRESIWWADDLTAAEKLLLLALSRFMDLDTLAGARPGRAMLQRLTSLSEASVKRLIRSVIAKGWLVEVFRGGIVRDGQLLASIYRGATPKGGHGDPQEGVMVSPKGGHGDPPPFKGPGDPPRGFAPGSPNNTPSVPNTSANGPRCEVCNDLPLDPPCAECTPEIRCTECATPLHRQRDIDTRRCPRCRLDAA